VPVYVGIAGNELADGCAKEATLGDSTPLSSRITLFESPLSLSKAAAIAYGIKSFVA
jgi:hypothetical protein